MRSFIALLFLAACGGGGGDDPLTTAQRIVAFDDLFTDITATGVTPLDQLPTSGGASYSGDMKLMLPLGPSGAVIPYLGRMEAVINFGPAMVPVSGHVSGFETIQDQLSGVLRISDGVIDLSANPTIDYLFAADLTGELSNGSTNYDIDGEIAGDFYGRAADAVAGIAFGALSDGSDINRFDGSFAAVSP